MVELSLATVALTLILSGVSEVGPLVLADRGAALACALPRHVGVIRCQGRRLDPPGRLWQR